MMSVQCSTVLVLIDFRGFQVLLLNAGTQLYKTTHFDGRPHGPSLSLCCSCAAGAAVLLFCAAGVSFAAGAAGTLSPSTGCCFTAAFVAPPSGPQVSYLCSTTQEHPPPTLFPGREQKTEDEGTENRPNLFFFTHRWPWRRSGRSSRPGSRRPRARAARAGGCRRGRRRCRRPRGCRRAPR